ncbi:MAG: universal stress protein [Saprospiraceae bacterium]|nr:universal stress protein [Saprospiraceae bacterium]
MKKILVPTDFSPIANKALEVAVEIAKKHHAVIELLNVNVFPSSQIGTYYSIYSANLGSIDEAWKEIIDEAKKNVDECIAKYPSANIKPFVAESTDNFVDELLNHKADLIVMGSNGAHGLKELMQGSNSEEVIRLATCPVLVVKNEDYVFKPSKIVFAVDLTKHVEFIQKAQSALPIENAEHHFLHVDTDMKSINYTQTKENMFTIAQSMGIRNIVTEVYEARTVEEGILEYAKNIGASIIVMYTHGRTGISHFFMGSIAEDVVNHSEVPVLTYVER